MFKKCCIYTTMLFCLLGAGQSYAQMSNLSSQDQENLSFCYGVYAASKGKKEVQKNNQFLEKNGNIYATITAHPAYQEGFSGASKLPKEQKGACYLVVYGFLGAGYALTGQKDDKTDLTLAYCMGYINAAREATDSETVAEFCSQAAGNETERQECTSEVSKLLSTNRAYQQGRKDTKNVRPVRLLDCSAKLSSASEDELNAAFGPTAINLGRQASSQQGKSVVPKKRKDMITMPIFPRVVKKK